MQAFPADTIWRLFSLEICRDLAPNDIMNLHGNERHYFAVGRSAALKIATALACRAEFAGGDAPIETILDFGCGFGRVARYLRAMLPEARLEVMDLIPEGVNWCVQNLGCAEMGTSIPQARYDLIWVGSVLTHISAEATARLLSDLKAALKPMGVLIFTTHGRFSFAHLEAFAAGQTDRNYKDYGLDRDAAARIVADYRAHGFGFHEYRRYPDYGIAVATPEWYMRATASPDILQLLAEERGWDGHQDVFAYLRVPDLFVPQSEAMFDPKG
jgi:SAM-dependent methyltransferase